MLTSLSRSDSPNLGSQSTMTIPSLLVTTAIFLIFMWLFDCWLSPPLCTSSMRAACCLLSVICNCSTWHLIWCMVGPPVNCWINVLGTFNDFKHFPFYRLHPPMPYWRPRIYIMILLLKLINVKSGRAKQKSSFIFLQHIPFLIFPFCINTFSMWYAHACACLAWGPFHAYHNIPWDTFWITQA